MMQSGQGWFFNLKNMRPQNGKKREFRFTQREVRLLATTLITGVMSALVFVFVVFFPVEVEARERQVSFSSSQKVSNLNVTLGKSQTIRLNTPYVDLVVGDPSVADAMPLTDQSLYVLGKKSGTTNVSIYDQNKKLVGIIDVDVSLNTNRLNDEVQRRLPNSRVNVSSVNGQVMLSGDVPDSASADKAVTLAKQFSPDVINSLTVSRPQQVMLEVRFLEASRSATKEIGVKWNLTSEQLTAVSGLATLISGPAAPFGSVLGRILGQGVQVDALINALEDNNLARRLAEPNLVALSGEKASFLAGGEYPYPIASSNGQISIEFKKFGVGLNFTPTVLGNGVINLRIEPEVSQLDNINVVRTGSVTVPGIIVRRASTMVELRDGQSFAIAGLLQSVNQETQQQLPWLGDIPVIGALFRSSAFQRNETDLAIIVTPRLVKPARPGQRLHSPLDKTAPANDVDLFLMGKREVKQKDVAKASLEPQPAPSGHFLDFISGGGADVAR
jgi:pilus assembly protein CpaC